MAQKPTLTQQAIEARAALIAKWLNDGVSPEKIVEWAQDEVKRTLINALVMFEADVDQFEHMLAQRLCLPDRIGPAPFSPLLTERVTKRDDGWTIVLFDNEDQFQAFRTVGRDVIGFNTHASGYTVNGQRYIQYSPIGVDT